MFCFLKNQFLIQPLEYNFYEINKNGFLHIVQGDCSEILIKYHCSFPSELFKANERDFSCYEQKRIIHIEKMSRRNLINDISKEEDQEDNNLSHPIV